MNGNDLVNRLLWSGMGGIKILIQIMIMLMMMIIYWRTNRSLTWQFAKDSEVWFCHRGKWQKNNGRSSNYFCNHLTFVLFFIRPKCIVSTALFIFASSTFTFIFKLFKCRQDLPVLRLHAPEEVAFATKACAINYF